ncbi:SAP domain-containing protein, partial [Candidatus Accumulibacter vicinus]|uniref:SAP domain-containing protein n=1 Tax=Candidatus Accumulibacter vicinus TaxID=2954382 RepID=UPI00235B64A7
MKLHEQLNLLTVDELKQRRDLTPSGDRSTRKAEIIEALAQYLLAGDLGSVWQRLSALDIDAIAEAVHHWGGRFDPVRFRLRYGKIPEYFVRRSYISWGRPKVEQPSVLKLFFYHGEIPEDLLPRLAGLAPRPAELAITTLSDDELPTTVASHAAAGASEPLRLVATEALGR